MGFIDQDDNSVYVYCDGPDCDEGHEDTGSRPAGWLVLDERPYDPVDFCSWRCLGRYANLQRGLMVVQ
jgi:hypothetical protein